MIRRLLVVMALGATLAACTGVKAYQRGKLAKAKMQFNPRPETTTLEQHVFSYREGSTGGYEGGGGGCGCN